MSAEFDGTLTTRPDGPIFLFDPTTYRPDRVRDSPVLRALMAHFGQGAREIAMVGIDGEHCVVDLSSRRQGQDAVHALGSRILQICQELARPSVG
ncbi:MAG TPA: hypothetical protein VLE99_02170 [Candidatus Saccharimonadales bacterium]|nr:hypothetical protein [Candidatus Saccharimonadales bacterium]